MHDNVYTFNRGWEVGATVTGTLQGNESGAIDGQDAPASAIPSPPIVAFDRDGNTIAGWGNPTLFPATQVDGGFAAYLPHGAHGCFVDYQGYFWVGGNGDGIVQKYNPVTAATQGAGATFLVQLGVCGILPCPGHNAGHFAFGHTTAVDSKGDIYVAETITGRRIQKFVQVKSEGDDHQ